MGRHLQLDLQDTFSAGATTRAAPLVTGELHIERDIDALAVEWEALAQRLDGLPYLRPGWVRAWWRAFGAGDLQVRAVRRDQRLIALVPVARRRGALSSITNGHSPQFGLLAEDAAGRVELARSLFVDQPRRVSLSFLADEEDGLEACHRAAEEAGYRVLIRSSHSSPYLRLDGDWSGYESSLSRNLLTHLRRSWRRLEKLGKVEVEIGTGEPFETLNERLHQAFAVEASGWKGGRGTAIQSRPQTRQFYTEVARWAAARGNLRLFFLRLDSRALAMFFGLKDGGVGYLLKGGYDPEFSRYSPGILLMHAVVEHGFSAGLSRIEFHGGDDAYKLRWASELRPQKILDAFSRSIAGELGWAALAHGRPAAKRVLGLAGARKGDGRPSGVAGGVLDLHDRPLKCGGSP